MSLLLLITALVGAVFTSISGPARSSGIELGSGSSDNSMGQGSKEDDPAVKIVQGSVPKQKSALTRFYAASDFVNGENRFSTSFTSEVKDFVVPQSVHVSNCGSITIKKVAENGNGTFNFGTSGGLAPAAFDLAGGANQEFLNVPSGTG